MPIRIRTDGAEAWTVDPADFGVAPGEDIPFNIRIYENDGECPDGWIEWRPFYDAPSVVISAPSIPTNATRGVRTPPRAYASKSTLPL